MIQPGDLCYHPEVIIPIFVVGSLSLFSNVLFSIYFYYKKNNRNVNLIEERYN